MHKVTKRVDGFTLIELVVVIIILGILAIIVAPKFIDINRDAKVAVVEGAYGSIKDALEMIHMKAQIENKLGDNENMETQYGYYQFYRGYPETRSEATNPYLYFIETFLDLGTPSNEIKNNSTRTASYGDLNAYENNDVSRAGYGSGNLLADLCYAEYRHTSSIEVVSVETEGC